MITGSKFTSLKGKIVYSTSNQTEEVPDPSTFPTSLFHPWHRLFTWDAPRSRRKGANGTCWLMSVVKWTPSHHVTMVSQQLADD